jgi:hypothetical protein
MASTILSDNGVSSGSAGIKTSADGTGVLALQTTTAGGAATTAVTIGILQNVGIGTTDTTDQRLKIKQSADTGAASFSFKVEANANDTGLFLGYRGIGAASAADTCAILASYTSTGAYKPLTFLTSDVERMRIGSNGDIDIGGVTDAGNTLRYFDIYNTNTGASAGSIIRLVTSNSAASGNTTVDMIKYKSGAFNISNNEPSTGAINLSIAGTTRMTISTSGVVAVNTNVGLYTLDVTGISTAYAASATQDFPNMSGIIIANSSTTGYNTMWICGGGSAALIANANGALNNGTLAYVAGINGYRWTNNYGASNTTTFFILRTRPSA